MRAPPTTAGEGWHDGRDGLDGGTHSSMERMASTVSVLPAGVRLACRERPPVDGGERVRAAAVADAIAEAVDAAGLSLGGAGITAAGRTVDGGGIAGMPVALALAPAGIILRPARSSSSSSSSRFWRRRLRSAEEDASRA